MRPLRTCIGCMGVFEQGLLIRIAKDSDGNISVTTDKHRTGRGAYICRDLRCIDKAIKSRRLNRAFKCEVDDKSYELIRKKAEELINNETR